ncbi:MAG: eukaryotic-like serine/threonine-protein kinase, partial [Myxococcales bacterium]|nr:eukaryotic-like serine/threonine-protein kinase [Myxococcales bacterium]
TGAVFRMRPEDGTGVSGIGNSGYLLDPSSFVARTLGPGGAGDPIVHRRTPSDAKSYLGSSEFCGACHDVRLFGTDSLGVREKGEHFKRLRNAYSEWKTWADTEKAAGRRAASCQDCHMSLYPGVCVAGAGGATAAAGKDGCPTGFHFESRAPGEKARGMIASSSSEPRAITSHYFTSVDLPLSTEFDDKWANDTSLDVSGSPIGLELRRRQLLTHTFKFGLGRATRSGGQLDIPIEVQNSGAGHRVPAGFSQEREIWVELSVTDARGGVVYEVGKISDDDADLRDKAFVRVSTRDDNFDFKGKPQGVFGADVVDGPDVPRWAPNPVFGGTTFRGKGLVNFQNGFLRCVKCIGFIDRDGKCQAGPGQGRTRADRFDDGIYDLDTGECRSNLSGSNAFFETYFPVGALDADRGVAKAPDAILDTRSVPPGPVIRYTYELETAGHPAPYVVRAKLRFRPFPPFLLRAFADYEARKASAGLRPSGAQLTTSMLKRNHPIDLAEASTTID